MERQYVAVDLHAQRSLIVRVKVIQARLGHRSAKTTLDVYGHLFPDEEDRTRQAVDDAWAEYQLSTNVREEVSEMAPDLRVQR